MWTALTGFIGYNGARYYADKLDQFRDPAAASVSDDQRARYLSVPQASKPRRTSTTRLSGPKRPRRGL